MGSRDLPCPQQIFFPFEGTVPNNGMSFADIDNDNMDELIVCNQEGRVVVFKDVDGAEPYLSARVTGTAVISCHIAGDIMNIDEISLIVISWDGSSFIFHVEKHGGKPQLKCILTCKLPINIRSCLIDDTYHDKCSRLVVLSIDNVVSSYKWENPMSGDFTKGELVCMTRWETISAISSISVDVIGGDNGYVFSTNGGVLYTIDPYDYKEDGAKNVVQQGRQDENSYFQLMEKGRRLDPQYETFVCGAIEVLRSENSLKYIPKENLMNRYCQAVASDKGSVVLVKDGRSLWRIDLKNPIMHLSHIIIPVESGRVETSLPKTKEMLVRGDPALSSFDSEADRSSPIEDDSTCKKDFHLGRKTSLPLCAFGEYLKGLDGVDASSSSPDGKPTRVFVKNPNLIPYIERYQSPCKSFVVAVSLNGDTYYFDVDDGFYYKQSIGRQISTCSSGSFHVSNKRLASIAYAVLDGIVLMTDVSKDFKRSNTLEESLLGNETYLCALKNLNIDFSDTEAVRVLNEYLLYGYVPRTEKIDY